MNDRGRTARAGSAGSSEGRTSQRSANPHRRFRGYRWRNPLGVGLGISAALHLLLIILYSLTSGPSPSELILALPENPNSSISGTEIVNIVAVEGDVAAPIRPDPELEEVVEAPTFEPESGPAPRSLDEFIERRRTAGEILRPHAEDSILLREVNPEFTRLSDARQAQLRMNWMVNEWNELEDSERRAAEEALDWTYTDEEGNKWGVSPGKLHLGGLTLPLPALSQPEGVDPAADRLRRDVAEVTDQAARGLVWQNWQRRAAEIRKRKDRERAERLGGQRVDTTGVRR